MLNFFKTLSSRTKGILLINIAILAFSFSNALIKASENILSVREIFFFGSLLFFLPFYSYFLFKRKGIKGANSIFRTQNIKIQTFRSIIGSIGLLGIFYGFSHLPLAEASALNFSTTFFVTVLSVPILKESIGWQRWIAVILGFLGVLLIAQPSTTVLCKMSFIASIAAILGAFFDAICLVYNRFLSKIDNYISILAYYSLWCVIISSLFFFINPSLPNIKQSFLIIGITIGSSLGQYAATKAFFYAEASLLSPFLYLLIAWGTLFGYLFWNEEPTLNIAFGSFLIIFVSIFLAKVKKKPQT